jgi:ribonuclease P protein component
MAGKSSKDAGAKGASGSPRQSPKNKGAQSFGREYSLKEDLAIKRVFNSGKKFKGSCLSIFHYGAGSLPLKVVIKVPKSNGSAPRRNRIKRIVREVIRKNKEKFESRGHLVIISNINPDVKSLYEIIEKDLFDFAEND